MKKIFVALFAIVPLLFAACDKNDDIRKKIELVDLGKIYAAGYHVNESGVRFATLWNSGREIILSSGKTDAQANSIAIAESRIYVAGTEGLFPGECKAVLWVDGIRRLISDPSIPAEAMSVFVTANDVYVCGIEHQDGGGFTPVLWVNNARQELESQSGNAIASSVFVAGSDVYVAGYESTGSALLWKNGTIQTLEANTAEAIATSVYVSGSDVYVAGRISGRMTGTRPVLWKNGSLTHIDDSAPASANSVYVYKGNVYLAGTVLSGTATTAAFWKNGTAKQLPIAPTAQESAAYSVFADDKNFYVGGNEGLKAVLWFNGARSVLTDGKGEACVRAVCVVPERIVH